MSKWIILLRIVLTMAILYAVYTETGWATTLFAFLTMLACEVTSWQIKQLTKIIDIQINLGRKEK